MMFPKQNRIISPSTIKRYQKEHPMCEFPRCFKKAWLGPHHIIFKSQLGNDTEDNLISLCQEHHDEAHGKKLNGRTSREMKEILLKLKHYL